MSEPPVAGGAASASFGPGAGPLWRRLRRPLPARWRYFTAALAVFAAAGAVLVLALPGQYALLFLLAAYCIPANSALPIPHEPGILQIAVLGLYHPVAIGFAGTCGAVVAAFLDYQLIDGAFQTRRIAPYKETRLFKIASRSFLKHPFLTIVVFCMIPPLPFWIARILGPASGYPQMRYIGAVFTARLVRFSALAWAGDAVKAWLPGWVIPALFVGIALSMISGPLVVRLRAWRRARREAGRHGD